MSQIPSAPLTRAIARLIIEVDTLVDVDTEDVRPEVLDKFARAITSQLKALQDINAHNIMISQQDEKRQYLSYESLPAPNPDERERFRQRLEHLITKIEAR